MSSIIVDVGGIAVSRHPEDIIKTFGLGSCVSVVIFSPVLRVAGMVHVALPDSALDREKAFKKPGYFADTGIPVLLAELKRLGVNGSGNLVVKLMGGANVMDDNNVFNIGKRNVLSIRKHLWQNRLAPHGEDVGGSYSRTVFVEVGTGKIILSSPSRGQWEL
jgi:chemotaxis protein CheD